MNERIGVHVAAVLSPDNDEIAVHFATTQDELFLDLRAVYDQGGVYDMEREIVDDLENDGYTITITEWWE
jgi:hypothetical protein